MNDAQVRQDPIPAWDAHLDEKKLSELSPAHHRARNDASLSRKVAIIEAAARSQPEEPLGPIPYTMKAMRGWFDEELRLWTWSGREVDDRNGRNRVVIERLLAAWASLKVGRPDRAAEPRQPSLKRQHAAAIEQRNAMEAQLARLLRERNRGGPKLEDR